MKNERIRLLAGILITGILMLPFHVKGQHSIVYSQYLFNGLLINPAYAGSHVQLSGTLTYRDQWVNFEGSPETVTFGMHSSIRKGKIGVGLLATSDQIGSYRNTGVFGSYSYKIKDPVTRGVLSFGLQAGFNNFNADFGDLNLKLQADPTFGKFMSEFKPNFGGGVFYYNDKLFAGFSVPTILTHAEFFESTLESLKLPRFYYLHAGLKLPLDPRTKNVVLQPSVLLRAQDGTPISVDLNLNLVYQELISVGTSYRTGEGAVTFINFKLNEKFYVGYSYDWTISEIRRYSKGSHEIMLNFRSRIRNIHRDLDCPNVFSH